MVDCEYVRIVVNNDIGVSNLRHAFCESLRSGWSWRLFRSQYDFHLLDVSLLIVDHTRIGGRTYPHRPVVDLHAIKLLGCPGRRGRIAEDDGGNTATTTIWTVLKNCPLHAPDGLTKIILKSSQCQSIAEDSKSNEYAPKKDGSVWTNGTSVVRSTLHISQHEQRERVGSVSRQQ